MGKLTTIVIERLENGFTVEDFFNNKSFVDNEVSVVLKVKAALQEWNKLIKS